jgi:hypothetical protein
VGYKNKSRLHRECHEKITFPLALQSAEVCQLQCGEGGGKTERQNVESTTFSRQIPGRMSYSRSSRVAIDEEEQRVQNISAFKCHKKAFRCRKYAFISQETRSYVLK